MVFFRGVSRENMTKFLQYNWKLSPENPFHAVLQDFPEAGSYPVLDVHQALHLNCVLKGSIRGRIGNDFFRSGPGDLILDPPWEIHGDNQISAGLQLYCITVDPDALLEAFPVCRDRLPTFFLAAPGERRSFLDQPELKARIGALIRELQGLASPDEAILKMRQWLTIQRIFSVILEFLPPHRELAHDVLRLAPAMKLLVPGKTVTLSDAAQACELGVRRFSQLFRKVYRTTFSAYQLDQRLNRSAVDLRRGMSVKMAAAAGNFYDTNYFVKCFSRKFGVTLGDFRR